LDSRGRRPAELGVPFRAIDTSYDARKGASTVSVAVRPAHPLAHDGRHLTEAEHVNCAQVYDRGSRSGSRCRPTIATTSG
jgi:hypothetical protein